MQQPSTHEIFSSTQPTTIIPIDQILAPQTQISQNELIRLGISIKKYGILTPITVKKERNFSLYAPQYTVIDGKKRLAAAKIAGLEQIPCRILQESDADCAIDGILHNLKLAKLHFLEQAAAYQLLARDFNLTQSEIAKRLQISQSTVANRLRLLAFSKDEQLKIVDFGITERHARALLRLRDPQMRSTLLQSIRANRLSVAQTEAAIEQVLQEQRSAEWSLPPRATETGARPRKFALQSLTPLYNSINRSLEIFRKTGIEAHCTHEEDNQSTRIIVEIPKS